MSTKLEDIVRDATIEVDAVNKKENRTLYKKREPIFPKRAVGQFRRLKWLIMIITLSIYYLVPFLRWDRGPGAPDQAVLIDFPGNRFYFFFIELWPQEVYYITGILIVAALLLFFFTSLFGRVWCGYSCPQTVWTDLFIAVERWVEGDRNARIKLHRAPWSLEKIGKYCLKHTIWLLIGIATGGAWVFYFADAPTLFVELFTLQADIMAYSFVALLTFTTYTLGGLAREQVCIYMCPWPRIQGAMMDEDSLQVTYKLDRGEPRGRAKKAHDDESFGDCIDCKQCVVVCPMGIDIRDGSQLECINCALCIDACDAIMDKMGTPRGLIAYDTDANLARRIAGKAEQFTLLRMRTVVYAFAILFVCAVMSYVLVTRSSLDLNVLRDRNPIFVKLSDGSIRNGYTVKILNKERSVRQFAVSVDGLPVETLKINDIEDNGAAPIVEVKPDSLRSVHLFISVNEADLASASEPVTITVTDTENGNSVTYDSVFIGPEK
ncbi:cytochrome c oxidase accessory protein CcoG [Kiloniella laminariae]|uniref:cytochrome c oxidase accessory protein CcoG n=1 Tax=Kiloniella laminariae TaxID=454162 RepID=UPI0003788AD5|nr:cytochrome c oxidase accessory protein CcoG [Kiloniella laminariae]